MLPIVWIPGAKMIPTTAGQRDTSNDIDACKHQGYMQRAELNAAAGKFACKSRDASNRAEAWVSKNSSSSRDISNSNKREKNGRVKRDTNSSKNNGIARSPLMRLHI
jgi:hypothetical protein